MSFVSAHAIQINFYDENSHTAIPTVTITDANGSTYTSDVNGLWIADLTGPKELVISKTGYDSRPLQFYFNNDANYNFLLNPTGLDSNIGFIVKDSNNNLWTNKYLMFNKNIGYYNIPEISFDSNLTEIPVTSSTLTLYKTFNYIDFNYYVSKVTNETMRSPGSSRTCRVYFYYKDGTTPAYVEHTATTTGWASWTYVNPNPTKLIAKIEIWNSNTGGNGAEKNDIIYKNKEYITNIIISSILTSSSGTATASLLPAGDYTALLYDATGTLVDTYEKTTVTVNKPKNEKTSALISPYDIYVSGLLQYNLTNKSESSVTFNVFAGTTGFYTFTAVDYNTVVADQKYIPKSYFVQVPMGNDYESAVSYTPYLLLKTDGIVPKVVVLDQLNRTIENAQIYVSKYVGGVLTIVESGNTFSNGAFNFSAYPLDVYYLTVYYNGTDYGTFSVQPRESSDIFYIKIDRTTAEDVAQKLLIQTNLDDTSRYQNRDTNINVLGTITSNFNYITDYNVNVYERGNLVYSVNTVATGLSIDINKFVDVNLIPDYVHSAVIKVIVNYSIAGVTGSQTFSKNIIVTDNTDVLATVSSAVTEIDQPLSMFIALAVAIMLMAVLIFFGILTDPAILAVFGALVIGVFMMLGFLDIGVVVLGMDIGRFAYFLGLMATLYFALFGGR